MSKEQPQWPNPEPSAKKLKRRSRMLLGSGVLLAVAGLGTFVAGDSKQNDDMRIGLPLSVAGIGSVLAAGIAVHESTETYRTALLKENIEKHRAKKSDSL